MDIEHLPPAEVIVPADDLTLIGHQAREHNGRDAHNQDRDFV